MVEVSITTDTIKLDQFLKWAGVCGSGAEAKEIIKEGIVSVNGEVTFERGRKLHKGDIVNIEGSGEFSIG